MHPVHVTFHNTRCAVLHAVDSTLLEVRLFSISSCSPNEDSKM